MPLSIMIDVIVIVLMGATIFYTMLVNRRLTSLQEGRDQLQTFVESFGESLQQAERSVKELKETGQSIYEVIQKESDAAVRLRDDLVFLTERGEQIADELDKSIMSSRAILKSAKNTKPEAIHKESAAGAHDEDEAEDSLLLKTLIHVR